MERSTVMSGKRRDNKNRILRNGESQRKDGRYAAATKKCQSPKNLDISRKSSKIKEFQIDDQNTFHLPRQYVNSTKKPLVRLHFPVFEARIYYQFTTFRKSKILASDTI